MAETIEILNTLLPQIATEHGFKSYDLEVEPISSGGANYTSNLYNVTIEEGTNTHHMFAKVAALGEKMRSQSPRFYNTEIYVYTKLAKVYESLENEHQVPKEHRLTLSKFYGYNPKEYEETVVLENLVKKGYQPYDRFKSIDWEYASSALTELAKLHALSFAYSEYYPEDFNQSLKQVEFEWNLESGPMVEYFNVVSERAINTVAENTRDKLKSFFDAFGPEKCSELFESVGRPVLVHGDFRPSNLMHKIREDGTVDIKVVDLQTMQGSSPAVDLLYFIFTGSDEQFRAQYYEKLLDHYYEELQAAMKRLHLEPEDWYSRADFDKEMKQKMPFGVTISVFALPIVTVAAEDAPKVDKDMEFGAFAVDKPSDRYAQLLNGVINDYIKWGVLK